MGFGLKLLGAELDGTDEAALPEVVDVVLPLLRAGARSGLGVDV